MQAEVEAGAKLGEKQSKTRQDMAWPDMARKGKAREVKTRQRKTMKKCDIYLKHNKKRAWTTSQRCSKLRNDREPKTRRYFDFVLCLDKTIRVKLQGRTTLRNTSFTASVGCCDVCVCEFTCLRCALTLHSL
jgi:hypothetical protein